MSGQARQKQPALNLYRNKNLRAFKQVWFRIQFQMYIHGNCIHRVTISLPRRMNSLSSCTLRGGQLLLCSHGM